MFTLPKFMCVLRAYIGFTTNFQLPQRTVRRSLHVFSPHTCVKNFVRVGSRLPKKNFCSDRTTTLANFATVPIFRKRVTGISMSKGFGQQQKIDKLVDLLVCYCRHRCPESLDEIFDNLPANVNEIVLEGALKVLQLDSNTLSWFCSYMASEINHSEDNYKPLHPIMELSRILIEAGMQPFTDFMPYVGCRLIIDNMDKFEALPKSILAALQQYYRVVENSGEQFQQINNAKHARTDGE